MEPAAVKQKIEELVEAYFQQGSEYFLVDVKVLPGNKVQVFIDGDKGVQIEKCAELSRHLEKYLDEHQWLGEKYVLEVSSPGMDNPLKVLRQYKRRIDSAVRVVTTNGQAIEGLLREADDEAIVVEEQRFKKKKLVHSERVTIPFNNIKTTKLKLNF